MAWLSVGTSNEDLCQKMVENEVLHEGTLLEAFRATDRGDFVPEVDRLQAYADRPFKKGQIHISAPHMYVTVLEELDLQSGKSFLNIGSGSGYLSCLAAFLLGKEGVSHGVEISEFACNFSRERAKAWHTKLINNLNTTPGVSQASVIAADGISFVNANCFDIDVLSTVNTFKYDRIYIGAGCPDSRKEFFLSMLSDNGILVVPINEKNQMLSIRKFCGRVYSVRPISNVNFAPLLETSIRIDEEEILSELAVREGGKSLSGDIEKSIQKVQTAPTSSSFIIHPIATTTPAATTMRMSTTASSSAFAASVSNIQASSMLPTGSTAVASMSTGTGTGVSLPNTTNSSVQRIRLPPLVWAPMRTRHLQFPVEFRRAVVTILLANNRFQSTGVPDTTCPFAQSQTHLPGCRCSRSETGFLPHQIWLYIFSFANREWFNPVKSDLLAVSMELAVERRLRKNTEEKLRRAEEGRRVAERERDLFRIAMIRVSKHHRSHNNPSHHSSSGHMASSGFMLAPGLGPSFLEVMDGGSDFDEDTEEDEDEHDFEEDEEEVSVSGLGAAPVHANTAVVSTSPAPVTASDTATHVAAVSSVSTIVPHSHMLTQEEEEEEEEEDNDAMEQEDSEPEHTEEAPHVATVTVAEEVDAGSMGGIWTDIPDAFSTSVAENGTQLSDTSVNHDVTMTSPTPPAAFTTTATAVGTDPGAYWYAYNSYMDSMQQQDTPLQLSSSHCPSTSYNSTRTGTTAESTASTWMTDSMNYPPHTNGNGNGNGHNHHNGHHNSSNSSGERISDCTVGWEDHDPDQGAETEEEGEDPDSAEDAAMFFEVDEA